MSEHQVQNVPADQILPPGSGEATVATSDIPAEETVTIDEETSGAQTSEGTVEVEEGTVEVDTEVAAEPKPKKRGGGRKVGTPGARKLSDKERDQIGALILLLPSENEAPSYQATIPIASVPEEIKTSFYGVSAERNIFQRGLVIAMFDDQSQLMGLQLTEIAVWLYNNPGETASTAAPAAKIPTERTRTTTQYDGLRLKLLVDTNPRQAGSQGFYSFQLYQDGMTYREYMAIKEYKHISADFKGPLKAHWDWDLTHGYFGLYRENEPETLEDGSANPKYWAMKISKTAEAA